MEKKKGWLLKKTVLKRGLVSQQGFHYTRKENRGDTLASLLLEASSCVVCPCNIDRFKIQGMCCFSGSAFQIEDRI